MAKKKTEAGATAETKGAAKVTAADAAETTDVEAPASDESAKLREAIMQFPVGQPVGGYYEVVPRDLSEPRAYHYTGNASADAHKAALDDARQNDGRVLLHHTRVVY